MKHRKIEHREKVALCRNNINHTCKFDEQCWYKHEDENILNTKDVNTETQPLQILKSLESRIISMENQISMEIN